MLVFLKMLACLAIFIASAKPAYSQEHVTLVLRDVIERTALFFSGNRPQAAIFIHQSGLDAESWTLMAKELQSMGVGSLPLESTSSEDILAAIEFLKKKSYKRIRLVGASIGGGSAMQAIQKDQTGVVDTIILLGTAKGDLSGISKVQKLFVVSKGDFFAARTYRSFEKASEPKELLVLEGSEHGQEMLEGPEGHQLKSKLFSLLLDQSRY